MPISTLRFYERKNQRN
nr:hypothetical protein [Paenibacillus herberti]